MVCVLLDSVKVLWCHSFLPCLVAFWGFHFIFFKYQFFFLGGGGGGVGDIKAIDS